ncbi:hypothetical protein OQJ62_03880 [Microbulbifer thermotolerans]|uniref:hypothetical protein n=1 Tax=Microbulbifer thermotolerans TaxID=252514 RepID=UPI00224971EE|nr:hypothetical protein [Microbulbifer thermotolerans]MCX2794060.1 hypothetical protein [Microbulbifer thermotolerans]
MAITALCIAFFSTVTFYAGMALARRIRNKWYAILVRLGSFLLGFIVLGIAAFLLDAHPLVAELAGRYFFYMLLAGALVYKLLLVKFIPLPQDDTDTQKNQSS